MSADHALDTAPPAAPLKVRFGGLGTGLMLAAVWIALIVATGLYRPDFVSQQTVLAVAFTMSIVGVLAMIVAAILYSGARKKLSTTNLRPERTIHTVQDTPDAVTGNMPNTGGTHAHH